MTQRTKESNLCRPVKYQHRLLCLCVDWSYIIPKYFNALLIASSFSGDTAALWRFPSSTDYNSAIHPIDLRNIQTGDLQAKLLLYIGLDLVINGIFFKLQHIPYPPERTPRTFFESISPLESKTTVST